MDQCQICLQKAEETHHINEQNTADKDGIINHYHKNSKHNLVPLCKKCHQNVTYNNLRIYGYIETNEGIRLDYSYIDNVENLSRKKYSDDQINQIKLCWSTTNHKKECISKLELLYDIKISITTFNKIIMDNY